MSDRSRRHTAAKSGLWSTVLQLTRFGLNSLVFLILVRWLTLEEIGAFAVAFAFARVSQGIQRSGFVGAVVQDPVGDQTYLDTLSSLSLAFSVLATAALFAASYALPDSFGSAASDYLAVISIIPILIGISVVSEGLLLRRLEIRALALRSAVSLSAAGAIAIVMGIYGYGGWALTTFAVLNAALSSFWAISQARWRPRGLGSRDAAQRALPVIFAISGRNLANICVMPGLQLIVGGLLGPADSGAFQIAQRFLALAETVAISPMRYVALPLFSKLRDDGERLSRVIVEATGLLGFLCAPIYLGLLAITDTLLPLVVGAQNAGSTALVLKALLLSGGIAAVIAVCNQALTVLGRMDVALSRAVLSLGVNVGLGVFAAQISVAAVGLGYSVVAFATAPVLLLTVIRDLNIPLRRYLRAALLPTVVAGTMAVSVWLLGERLETTFDPVWRLGLQCAAGAALYIGLSVVFLRRELRSMLSLARALLEKRQS